MKTNIAVLIGADLKDKQTFKEALDNLNFLVDGWRVHYLGKHEDNEISYMIDVNHIKTEKEKSKILLK